MGMLCDSYGRMLQSLRMSKGIALGPEDEAIVPVPCPIQLGREEKIKIFVWKMLPTSEDIVHLQVCGNCTIMKVKKY